MSLIPSHISFENLNLEEFDDSLPFKTPIMTVKEWLRRERRGEQWRQFAKNEKEKEEKLIPKGLANIIFSEEDWDKEHPPTHGLVFEIIDGKCVSTPVNLNEFGNVYKKFKK